MTDIEILDKFKRIAVYGGSFDPIHRGHMAIAESVMEQFALDVVVFVPAFHAPHKKRDRPTPALDRYAMVCLATNDTSRLIATRIEIEAPERPYSVQTLTTLKRELPAAELFFIIGADSWAEITTWREWETVLTLTNHIVVTRPGYPITFDHVTTGVRERILDLRGIEGVPVGHGGPMIYISDAVDLDISATAIREKVRGGDDSWKLDVPEEVAKYVEKYQIYS